MRPSEKKLKRITLKDAETNDQYQVLVVYGTYVSSRVMTLLDNKMIYEGFITVYTRGKLIPVSSAFIIQSCKTSIIFQTEVGTLLGNTLSWSYRII